jgi:hypothetical protein
VDHRNRVPCNKQKRFHLAIRSEKRKKKLASLEGRGSDPPNCTPKRRKKHHELAAPTPRPGEEEDEEQQHPNADATDDERPPRSRRRRYRSPLPPRTARRGREHTEVRGREDEGVRNGGERMKP